VNPTPGEARQQLIQLAIPDEGLSAHDGHVQGPVAIHEREYTIDERLALEVGDFAQRDTAPEVIVTKGVAAWAPERAFASDLYRERRGISSQNPAPALNDIGRIHGSPLTQQFSAR
jgi:hypothetical protein